MPKITTATPEQWQEVERIRKRWIDLQCEKSDDNKIRELVVKMWGRMGNAKPIVIIGDSPIQAMLFCWMAKRIAQLGDQLRDQLGVQLGAQIRAPLDAQLGDQLGDQLDAQLRAQLGVQLDAQLRAQLDAQPRYLMVWWGTWAGWYEGGASLGVEYNRELYDIFLAWCEHCPFVVAYNRIVFVSRKPTEIHWDGPRLHNGSGPSVRFADGYGLWSLRGVRVTKQIVEDSSSLTLDQIRKEENVEVKRIMIERWGWERYLKETKAKVLDQRKNDVEATHEVLFGSDLANILVCACPSTARVYPLEVPREVKTCQAAQNWLSCGLAPRIISAS